MASKRIVCKRCSGQGEIMGGGMMRIECDDCEGRGRLYPDEVPGYKKPVVIDKESKSYKNAISRIKKLHPDLTDEEVIDIFEKEYNKLD
jgi:hypothetical protein